MNYGNSLASQFDTKDGHGGRGHQHRAEMRRIAEEAINDLVPKIAEQYFTKAAE